MGYSLSAMLGSHKRVSYKTEILSGLTVSVALVPEAIAFAMIAGFSPLTGFYAAFVMGLVR
jgi:SulP family sulfate permease